MKKFVFIVILLLVVAIGAVFLIRERQAALPDNINIDTTSMKITSPVFENSRKMPAKYTCDDKNISPPLTISGVPEGAKSLALIVDDPDAPAGTWVHWTIWNMDPALAEIAEDSIPEGIEGVTNFEKPGYGGPCPHSGTHRYFFKLYALDTILDLPQSATKQMVEEKMQRNIIDRAELIGLYSRT